MEVTDLIKDIAIDKLREMPIYEELKKDFEAVQKYQEAVCVLVNDRDETDFNILRIGTILAYSVTGKILRGKKPKELSKDDWKDIADKVVDYGIMRDGQDFTAFVFKRFARYIEVSVDIYKCVMPEEVAEEILGLAKDIWYRSDDLEAGLITEPQYVDDCLWTSFEAMIKLLAAYRTRNMREGREEYGVFLRAVADFSVQYTRYKMYERELSLVNMYLEGQKELDEELEKKYSIFIEDLQTESRAFDDLIDNAFSPDFEDRLRNSVMFAKKAGVDDSLILDSREKIDSFFTE